MEIEQHVLRLTEYGGSFLLDRRDSHTLQFEPALTALEDGGIVRITRSSTAYSITPLRFVGEITTGRRRIIIDPRYPKFYRDVLAFLTQYRFRSVSEAADTLDIREERLADPAEYFVKCLSAAVSFGLPITFKRQSQLTMFPCGSINMSKTAAHWASSRQRHSVIAAADQKLTDETLATVFNAASTVAQSYPTLPIKAQRTVALCRVSLGTPDDIGPSLALQRAKALLFSRNLPPVLTEAVKAAASLLSGDMTLNPILDYHGDTAARFLRVDHLWELVVHETCKTLLEPTTKVSFHPFGHSKLPLFRDGGPNLDPDMVVGSVETPLGVIDAKYSLVSEAAASDVYQLLAYMDRLAARWGVLVYLMDANGSHCRKIGTTAKDQTLWEIRASKDSVIRSLRDGFRQLAEATTTESNANCVSEGIVNVPSSAS